MLRVDLSVRVTQAGGNSTGSSSPVQTLCQNKTRRAIDVTANSSTTDVRGGMVGNAYLEFIPGQIKLSDFAANGERCARCLTKTQPTQNLNTNFDIEAETNIFR